MAMKRTPTILRSEEGDKVSFKGQELFIKASEGTTDGAFGLIDYHASPDASGPPPHYHRESDEAFYILDGTFRVQLEDQTFDAGVGDFVHIPAGTVHSVQRTGDGDARLLALYAPAGPEGHFKVVAERLAQDPDWPAGDMANFAELGQKYDQLLPDDTVKALH
jgi:quercetin dioxygenase-like cupin family protein